MEDREQVARQLALKDKREWDKLEEIIQNAYRHNADEDIKCRAAVPVDEGGTAVKVSCSRCGDQAYIKGKPCLECNPVGLPADKVHPGIVVGDGSGHVAPDFSNDFKTDSTGISVGIGNVSLCDSCGRTYPVCDSPNVSLGEGIGKDNIIKCEIFSPIDPDESTAKEKAVLELEARQTEEGKEAVRQNRALGPNEYRCSKCSKPGHTVIHMVKKDGSGIGTKHQEFKIDPFA